VLKPPKLQRDGASEFLRTIPKYFFFETLKMGSGTEHCRAGLAFDPANIVDDNNAPIGVVKNPPRPTD
jgi:hypothetical protein